MGYNENMKDRYGTIIKITGFLLIVRALMFFGDGILIAYGRAMAVPSTVNEAIGPLILLFIYFVYCAILSLRLSGAFLGSHGVLFRNRLDKLTYSNYENGSELARRRAENAALGTTESKEVDVQKLESALSKPHDDRPLTSTIKSRAALILLLIDLALAMVLVFSLPELPKIYIDFIVEAIAIIISFMEVFETTAK